MLIFCFLLSKISQVLLYIKIFEKKQQNLGITPSTLILSEYLHVILKGFVCFWVNARSEQIFKNSETLQ